MHSSIYLFSLFLTMWILLSTSESKWFIIRRDYPEINCIACAHNLQNLSSVRCFPSFIIGGTQKSGTTVLAALLSLHSNISLAAKKEVHFFDKSEVFKKGLNFYLRSFHSYNVSTESRDLKLSVDATPSYISSRVSCQRISSSLPNAKILILLRNPISRAYSEYQMKARRVHDQQMFFKLILENQKQFRRCFDILVAQHHPESKFFLDSLKECSPKNITAHSRWPKLMVALRNANNVLTSWKAVFYLCFRRNLLPLHYGFGQLPSEYCNASQQQCRHIASEEEGEAIFDPVSCWSYAKHGFEVLNSLEKAFIEEIRDFESCASQFVGYTEDYSQLDKAVEECIKVKSGISTQYFYRSLYVAQLIHCFKFIDPRKVLILSDEELRRSPEEVLRRVIEFIGLNVTDDYVASVRDRDIGEVVREAFPKFETASGWKLQGDYEPIPETLKVYLQEFFRPFNRMLYQLTREPFIQTWDT